MIDIYKQINLFELTNLKNADENFYSKINGKQKL